MKIIQALIICLVFLTGLKLGAQNPDNQKIIEKILEQPVAKIANTFLSDTLMKSLSIAVHYKGEDFIRHFGELDEGKENKPNNNTIYEIGSVTKTFIGTLIAMAELDGKLSVEDDIRDYLDSEYPNLEYQNQPIKIKHLLTHTSRLPQFLPTNIRDEFNQIDEGLPHRISKKEKSYSKQKYFNDLKKLTIDTLPGIRYAYSNAGAELICFILEQVYDTPFEELLKQKLFGELNMTSTQIKLTNAQRKNFANGYGDYNTLNPAKEAALWGGSGHAKSTIPDLLNYMKYHLGDNDAVLRSHQVLFDKDIIHGDPRNKIGRMWIVSTDGDFGKYIKHHGGAFRANTWIKVYPKEQLGITVITNQSGMRTAGKLNYVADQILSEIAKAKYKSEKSETEQITETLMEYIEGSTNGQPELLKKAFHSDLNLYYIWNREFRVWDGKDYIADTREGEPTGEKGEILLIDYENNIATAKIRISHPENEVPYIDYLMLIKINGKWTIVHKMFTQEVKK